MIEDIKINNSTAEDEQGDATVEAEPEDNIEVDAIEVDAIPINTADPVEDQEAECQEEKQEFGDLQQKLTETQDKLLRVAAEFDNYKKRMEREQAKLVKYAGENILRELLNTLDNLGRAVDQGKTETDDDSAQLKVMLEGLDLTYKGLIATLEKFGVESIESVGQPFNPDEQDALTMEPSDEVAANHVLKVFAKGYRFKDRVLRHAQVVVSSGPKKTAE